MNLTLHNDPEYSKMPQLPPSRKRLRASSSDVSIGQDVSSTSASDARAALSARCAVDAVPHFWRERASKAGAVSADVFVCRIGHTVAAALRNVSESAEEARSQLQFQRAALHAAIDARYDILEQGITDTVSFKTATLERELCTIDGVLESWRAGCSGMRETLARIHDVELLKQHVMLNARLDDLESQLRALPAASMEPPFVGITADLSQLAHAISCFGHIIAPRAITASNMTLSGIPPYVIWGAPLVLRLTLGDSHDDQSREELDVALGGVACVLRVETVYAVDDAPSFNLDVMLSVNTISRRIDIIIPVPARPAVVAGVLRLNCVELSGISLLCARMHVPIACAFTAEELAAVDESNPTDIAAAMLAGACIGSIAVWGCSLLAKTDKFCDEVEFTPIVRTVVEVLRMHLQRRSVASSACNALACLAKKFRGVRLIAFDGGAAAVIVSAIKMHSACTDVFMNGCVALWNVTDNDVIGSQQAAVDAGAVTIIVAGMQTHADDVLASIFGCGVLGKVAFNFSDGQQALVVAGAPAAIVAAMQAHAGDECLAERGCISLGYITHECSFGQQAAVDSGAPEAIVAAMQVHIGSIRVSEEGCCALNHISRSYSAGQQAAVDAGAPAVIVAAMQAHTGVADVSELGCSALGSIACDFERGQRAAVDAGAPAAIVAIMQAHAGVARVSEMGCDALNSISVDYIAGQRAAVDAGAPAAIVAAMRVHLEDVSFSGCCALDSICTKNIAGKVAAVDAGAPAAIVAAILASFGAPEAECSALAGIACDFVAGQLAAVDAGAPAAILAVMQAHAENRDMTVHGFVALAPLASCAEGRKAIIAAGGVGAVTAAMERHESARYYGADVLELLTDTTSESQQS